jgi:predicted kinase
MSGWAAFINGVPGSGKSTLARALSEELGLPVVSKDAIKEALADALPAGLPTTGLGAIASDAMWSILGLMAGPVIVESFWFSGRDDRFFTAGLAEAGITDGVEVWCEATPTTTRDRFTTRPRHHAHSDAGRLDEWEVFCREARPMTGFPVVRVQTEQPVDTRALAKSLILPANVLRPDVTTNANKPVPSTSARATPAR